MLVALISWSLRNRWLVLAAALALAKDFFFWKLARRKLFGGFRELATRAVSPTRPAGAPPFLHTNP